MTTTRQPPAARPAPPRTPPPPLAPSTRRLIVAIGSIVALLIVLVVAVPVASRLLESTERVTHPLPSSLTAVTVESDVGDVTIRAATAGEQPGAVATVRSGLFAAGSEIVTDGSASTLTDDCRWWASCSVQWEIVVPPETSVKVVSGVGGIAVTDVTGPVSLVSGVGSVTGTGLGGDTIRVTSGVGDVTLALVAPPTDLQAVSSTGDLTVTVPADGTAYRVATRTSLGEVRAELVSDDTATRAIELTTSVGDITLRRG